ncbi:hypothetical protein ACA40_11450 [Pseudomonas syringae pv. lapsa]|jgi:hypothetical protein|uniref:Serine recombinase/resolvase protein n=1 Tax=Pseudomonas syringae pv. lapsa TaxID=199201 RepID=A0AB74A6L0_PSESX|nr:hypothetical protein [Pseudomonas syringae]ALU60445.1 hypothetical protein ACA40_11450 [Pseudomonas syringae pv. lapsa]RML26283.1 Serine recombinase/resolvase protein [Pseudomonas syringae pv. lapsa]
MDYCSFCSVFVSSGAVGATLSPTIFISGVVAVVGVAALFVAIAQMRIASAKIKLDLYNRRFSIYVAALDYYQSAWGKTEKNMTEAGSNFVRAFRESVFLFDRNDKIYETLNRIKDHGNAIGFNKNASSSENWPMKYDHPTMTILKQRSDRAYEEFEKDLLLLERQLQKYINFKTISGWRMFG